jgi:hypothetical protein
MSEIVNRVAQSGLITIDLSEWVIPGERSVIDLSPQLWQGLVLKETDFRSWIKENDWTQYQGQHVAITCSTEAIIPTWAFMLVASALSGVATNLVMGNLETLNTLLLDRHIQSINISDFQDQRVVVKGCSSSEVTTASYTLLVQKLQPVVKSLMFGEACSTVPLYKAPRK